MLNLSIYFRQSPVNNTIISHAYIILLLSYLSLEFKSKKLDLNKKWNCW